MKVNSIFLILLTFFALCSCVKKEKQLSHTEIINTYYQALNNRDLSNIAPLLSENILIKEGNDKMSYKKEDYLKYCQWDITFKPSYTIISTEETSKGVKVQVSKTGKRSLFLHKKPIVTEEIFEFKDGKISSINVVNYINFNSQLFINNRLKLRSWVDDNYPELNGFLYKQTPKAAKDYLKAIKLYQLKSD